MVIEMSRLISRVVDWWKLRRLKGIFPKEEKDYWGAFCAGWNDDNKDEVFPYWKYGRYVYHKVMDVVPLYKRQGYIGYYKIVGWYHYGSDNAGWDDGRQYSLKFDHIEKDDGSITVYISKGR
jgi:hypothetical protein